MSLYRLPDPNIDSWLADGPSSLSRAAVATIKSATRAMPQRRRLAVPWPSRVTRPMLVAAAAILTAVALVALAVGGSLWFAPAPEPSPSAVTSPSPAASPRAVTIGDVCLPIDDKPGGAPVGRAVLSTSRLSVEYSLPPEAALTVTMGGGILSFAADRTHGIVVVDVTGATRHGSLVEQPPLGTDAISFLDELDRRFPYTGGQVIDFDVRDITATTLGGRPAWSAVVGFGADHSSWTHIDHVAPGRTGLQRGCALEFRVPHRLIVTDVGASVVAVQLWAATEVELANWLPQAIPLADSLRISEEPL